tara:strand:- start:226 stop:939 length:714 start_codon:yes stop_codon:yes gene_type:complete
MELGVQNLDNFKDFFFNQSIEIDIFSFLISLLLSAILALLVKYVYLKCAMTLSNKSYFSDLFVPLSITTTLVITVIKFSLALSLGLVGALSIVRFRAAIKEPEELIYLFLIIGIGLACGANQYIVGISATIFIIIILFIFSKFRRSDTHMSDTKNINVLQLEIKNKSISIQKIIKILEKDTSYLNLKSSTILENTEIYLFWVEFKNKKAELKAIDRIRNLNQKDIVASFYSNENLSE